MNTTTNTKIKPRRVFGFILALIVLPFVGYAIAWNQPFIEELIASSGGIGWFFGAIAVIVIVFLVVFWPRKWPNKLRGVLTAVALLAAFIFGGEPVRAAFAQAPWATIAWFLGALATVYVLYGLLVPDKFPVPKFVKSWIASAKVASVAQTQSSASVETASTP